MENACYDKKRAIDMAKQDQQKVIELVGVNSKKLYRVLNAIIDLSNKIDTQAKDLDYLKTEGDVLQSFLSIKCGEEESGFTRAKQSFVIKSYLLIEKKLVYLYRDVSEKLALTIMMEEKKRKGEINRHANRVYNDMIYNWEEPL